MHRASNIIAVDTVDVSSLIHIVRGEQVILDSDLALLYGTTTSAFNQAISRNLNRFPDSFRFQITKEEFAQIRQEQIERTLRSQNVISTESVIAQHETHAPNTHGGRRYLPYVFTEEGVAMLSGILRSDIAARTSIHIMRSFVEMRHFITRHAVLFEHIKSLELQQLENQRKNDAKFAQLFDIIEENRCHKSDQKIFFDGQIFDAHSFLVKMIKQAKREIILVDGYVNINTLDVLANKAKGTTVKILTLPSSTLSVNEVARFNKQYPRLDLVRTTAFHDRFMIFDKTECYHIGASLKDAGDKCFAITRLGESHELSLLIARISEVIQKAEAKESAKEAAKAKTKATKAS
ncbi:ORF6N domain-containing protein [Candidatus Saccharibacteria bacterium]|nr:ORF6N domain-containing protein [Candidatus Saccharibacteria bacterium]